LSELYTLPKNGMKNSAGFHKNLATVSPSTDIHCIIVYSLRNLKYNKTTSVNLHTATSYLFR